MNKKGQFGGIFSVYTFFFIVAIILGAGIVLVVSSSVVNLVGDNILPTVKDQVNQSIGEGGARYVTAIEGINDAVPWITGVIYILAIFSILIFAYAYRISGENYLLVLYIVLTIVLILGAILMSNIYQSFMESGGGIGTRLQEMNLLSYLILYSPMVLLIMLSIGAVIMFVGIGRETI